MRASLSPRVSLSLVCNPGGDSKRADCALLLSTVSHTLEEDRGRGAFAAGGESVACACARCCGVLRAALVDRILGRGCALCLEASGAAARLGFMNAY